MNKKISLATFGHKLKSHGSGIYDCPVCNQPYLFVDTSDESNVTFTCVSNTCCTQAQVLAKLGEDPDATVYVGSPPVDAAPLAKEEAEQLLSLVGVPSFPEFVRLCKKNNNGLLPHQWQSVNVDKTAAALGYRITADRRSAYQIPKPATVASLLQMKIAKPPFAVEGLLPAGFCTFSAPPKSYKSWMVLDLCDSVANGGSFLGYSTHAGDVLYLDLEGSDYNLQDRMRKMGCRESEHFQFVFDAPPLGQGLLDFFEDWCKSVENPRLIVIDVLQKVKPAGSSSMTSYENDYAIYAPLNAFAVSRGIAVVGVTHNRKCSGLEGDDFERISGSVGQMASAQTSWVITGRRGIAEEKRLKAVGRNISEIDDVIRFDLNSWRWVNEGNSELAAQARAEREYENSPIRRTLIELLSADSSSAWYGTYADLHNEIAERTGEYPFVDAKALGIGIRPMLRLLAEKDGIYKVADTNKKNGAYYHKWFRKTMLGE